MELILLNSHCFHIGRILRVAILSVNAVRSWSSKLNSNLKLEKRCDGKIQTTSSRGDDMMMVYGTSLSPIQRWLLRTQFIYLLRPNEYNNGYLETCMSSKASRFSDQYTVILNVILIILTNQPQHVTVIVNLQLTGWTALYQAYWDLRFHLITNSCFPSWVLNTR